MPNTIKRESSRYPNAPVNKEAETQTGHDAPRRQTAQTAPPATAPRRVLPAWRLLFAAALGLYFLTLNRGIQWQDHAFHVLRILDDTWFNPLGLALSHPLHQALGHAFVWTLPLRATFAVTLISALGGAITVANTFAIVHLLTKGRAAAGFSAVSLAVAATFWQMSTLAETYTLVTALLSAEILFVLRFLERGRPRDIILAALFNGLGLANHLLAALTLPAGLVVIALSLQRTRIAPRHATAAALAWLVGASPYLLMIGMELSRTGDLGATISSALFGNQYKDAVLSVSPGGKHLIRSILFVVYNFPAAALPLAAVAIFRAHSMGGLAQRRYLLAALAVHAIFALRYEIVDQQTFFLPTYLLIAILSGIGFAHIAAAVRPRIARTIHAVSWVGIGTTLALYLATPALAKRLDVLADVQSNKPYRDDYVYLLSPWGCADTSAETMAQTALELAGEDGIILVEEHVSSYPIRYAFAERGLSEDRVLPLSHLDDAELEAAFQQNEPLVLVPRNRDKPELACRNCFWRRHGDLYVQHTVGDFSSRSRESHQR